MRLSQRIADWFLWTYIRIDVWLFLKGQKLDYYLAKRGRDV